MKKVMIHLELYFILYGGRDNGTALGRSFHQGNGQISI